jgi:integrase/recombinase XerD
MVMKGPLAPWASGMAERLQTLGYTPRMVLVHLQLAGNFSRFLLRRGASATDVSPELIEEFVGALRAKNTSWRPTSKRLSWLVEYLRDVEVTAAPVATGPRTAEEVLVMRYHQYLSVERGLEPDTVANYVRVATLFLTAHADRPLEGLGVGDISKFMTSQCRQVSVRQAERLATGLRSFLGFGLVDG